MNQDQPGGPERGCWSQKKWMPLELRILRNYEIKVMGKKFISVEATKNDDNAWDVLEDCDLNSKVLLHKRKLPGK